jgi:hypothetical protein
MTLQKLNPLLSRLLTPAQLVEAHRIYALYGGVCVARSSGPHPWKVEPPGDGPSPEFLERFVGDEPCLGRLQKDEENDPKPT